MLLQQHRTCCGLRGRGWGRKSRWLHYVYDHSFIYLVSYHRLVLQEMTTRGWSPNLKWMEPTYRGRFTGSIPEGLDAWDGIERMYPEHGLEYFHRCVALMRRACLTHRRPVPDEQLLRMERVIDAEVLLLTRDPE